MQSVIKKKKEASSSKNRHSFPRHPQCARWLSSPRSHLSLGYLRTESQPHTTQRELTWGALKRYQTQAEARVNELHVPPPPPPPGRVCLKSSQLMLMCIRQRSAESSVLASSQLPFRGAPKSRGLGQTRAEVSSRGPCCVVSGTSDNLSGLQSCHLCNGDNESG